MDVNKLGSVQQVATNSNRPQGAARETPRAAEGPTSDSTPSGTALSFGEGDEQPDPTTPRGSLLDISI